MTINLPKLTTKNIRRIIYFLIFALFIIGLIVGSIAADDYSNKNTAGYKFLIFGKFNGSDIALIYILPWFTAIILYMGSKGLNTFSKEDYIKFSKLAQKHGYIEQKEIDIINEAMFEIDFRNDLIKADQKNKDALAKKLKKINIQDKIIDGEKIDAKRIYKEVTGKDIYTREPIIDLPKIETQLPPPIEVETIETIRSN